MHQFNKSIFKFLLFVAIFFPVLILALPSLNLPFEKNESFIITTGYYTPPTHIGKDKFALDFSENGCQAFGKNVLASYPGKVELVSDYNNSINYGNYIKIISSDGNYVFLYGHLKDVAVIKGNNVVRGELLGHIGNSGNVAGNACPSHPGTHLHFAVYKKNDNGKFIAFKPEPISGYTNLISGMSLTSDNVLVEKQDNIFFSVVTNFVTGKFRIGTQPSTTSHLLETTPVVLNNQLIKEKNKTEEPKQVAEKKKELIQKREPVEEKNNVSEKTKTKDDATSETATKIPQEIIEVSPPSPASLTISPIIGSSPPPPTSLAAEKENSPVSSPQNSSDQQANSAANNAKNPIKKLPSPPTAPLITFPASFPFISSSTRIIITGTAQASSTITTSLADESTTTDADGNWTLAINLPEATTTVNFSASFRNLTSSSTETIFFVNSIPPALALEINGCNFFIFKDSCLISATSTIIKWKSADSDFKNINFQCSSNGKPTNCFSSGTSTEASSTVEAIFTEENRGYTIIADAYDYFGNKSEILKKIYVSPRPVVINEVAWDGTGFSATTSKDEWIELYNPNDVTANLDGMRLISLTDKRGPFIDLKGKIKPRSYYLIERTDDNTVADVPADLIASFGNGLSNQGEVIAIVSGSTTIDQTPSGKNSCFGWCGGGYNHATMERIDPLKTGNDSKNWGSFAFLAANGINADGQKISGTPGRRNSLNYLIGGGISFLTNDTHLTSDNSPYIVKHSGLEVPKNVTLQIDPGVVVKFLGSYINVDGKIIANGTKNDPIIFTSLYDDASSGDTNNDGTSTVAQRGDWLSIYLNSDGSEFNYSKFLYGGRYYDGLSIGRAEVIINNASAKIDNSIFKFSTGDDLIFSNASGEFIGNSLSQSGERVSVFNSGIDMEGGNIKISGNDFSDLTNGLIVHKENNSEITGNNFKKISHYPISIADSNPQLSGNKFTGNKIDGIYLDGTWAGNLDLTANNPYYVYRNTLHFIKKATLTLQPGVILKFLGANIVISGKLITSNSTDSPIIFTSLLDDSVGGDTNADGTSTMPSAGDWSGVFIDSEATTSLQNFRINYAGFNYGSASALDLSGKSLILTDCEISNNFYAALNLRASTTASVRNCAFKNNNEAAIRISHGAYLDIASSTFTDNIIDISNQGGKINDLGGNNLK